MSAEQRYSMVARHRESWRRHGYSTDTLFWSSRGVQKVRFKVLSEIGIEAGDSVLDVGCGFGDLRSWLQSACLYVDYSGIDLSPEIVEQGLAINRGANLQCGDLFDFGWPSQSFDWVVLSGTLNWKLGDQGAYAQRLIGRMYAFCRKGVAFNMLDARSLDDRLLGELASHDPETVMGWCRELTPHCEFLDNYLEHDFTIYMRR